MLREGDSWRETTWQEAFAYLKRRLGEIVERHGPDAIGFFNAPRCSNEESYLLQKLARAVIGTNNVDHGTGVYVNNGIRALRETLGAPAATACIEDISLAEAVLVDGIDLAVQTPTIGGWVIRSRLNGTKLIVVDARRHRVAEQADYFLQLKPGTDVLLYGAMAKILVDRGLVNKAFLRARCRNYEAFLRQIEDYDLLTVAEACGVDPDLLEKAALALGRSSRTVALYGTGSETRDPNSVRALVNLLLLGGHIGREGAGILPLAEHNNLQGVCDMGMMPDFLPGYAPVEEPSARRRFEKAWRVSLPAKKGVSAREFFNSAGSGRFRAAWLCRYDPAVTATFCDAAAALQDLDLVVVQHLFMTRSAEHAHVILPLTAFGEEEVTFTSTDRRIQIARRVIEPQGEAMPAWRQLTEVGKLFGADWHYGSAAEVMEEIRSLAPFYSGASYENLGGGYGRQWPCTVERPLGTPRLFAEEEPSQRFRLTAIPFPRIPEDPGPEYPTRLIFGQSLYYWHQNPLILNSEILRREYRVLLLDYPEGFVDLSREDAARIGVRDGGKIRLVSPTDAVETVARVTDEVRPGTVYVPFFLKSVEQALWRREQFDLGNLSKPVYVRVEKA